MTDKYVSELPKCKLCGCDPLPIEEAAYRITFCGNKSCTMRKGFYTEQQWRTLMGEPEPASSVPMPKNADQSELMVKAGMMWLEENAPERLKPASAEPIVFTCHGNSAPAYSCDKPGDQSGTYYRHPPAQQWKPTSEFQANAKSNYSNAFVSWGSGLERNEGSALRYKDRWFAAAVFYVGGPHDGRQFAIREIEVEPTHFLDAFYKPQPPEPE